ncbi:MAG: GHKL domain-containing protein [Clostridia bacterium]|nr:GHKL domain-containing protein [Clostridia bacterium]
MKRKMFWQILGLTSICLLLLFAAGTLITYSLGKRMIKNRLETETELVAALLDEPSDYTAFEKYYNNDELRVTIIAADDFKVLFESDKKEELETHKDREEVRYALEGNPKAVERYSETFHCKMTYYAVKGAFSDGTEVVVRLAVRSSEISSYFYTSLPFFALSCVLAIIIASALANRLSRNVSSKINEVSASLRSLNAGEYMPLHTDEREPEFYTLFNEINELNESTHKAMLREKEMVKQKSEFFANASHELKTPITVMRGLTEILLQDESVNERERKQLERIHKESIRMASLISDMLKISKLERGATEEIRESVAVKEQVNEVIAELSAEMQKKGVQAQCFGEATVLADSKKIFELVQNLLSNAVNYNKENGWIKVTMSETDSEATLCVKDGGIGIEKEHLPRLCERFYRVDKSRSKKTGGTGLGLSIVKHICALYGAKLEIDSELGVGTCVTVTFKK